MGKVRRIYERMPLGSPEQIAFTMVQLAIMRQTMRRDVVGAVPDDVTWLNDFSATLDPVLRQPPARLREGIERCKRLGILKVDDLKRLSVP